MEGNGQSGRVTPSASHCSSLRFKWKYVMDLDSNTVKNFARDQNDANNRGDERQYAIAGLSGDRDAREACLKLMQCSFCKIICPPENSQVCEQGHLTCSACVSRVMKCTYEDIEDNGRIRLCLKVMSVFKLEMYEYVFNAVDDTFRCENWNKGCPVVLRSEEKRVHRNLCTYRPDIGCPFSDCEIGEMNCDELISHLMKYHDATLVTSNAKMVTISFKTVPDDCENNYSWTPAIFQLLDYHFLLTILQKDGYISVWFYRLEKKKSRDNPVIELKIMGNDKDSIFKWEYVPRDFSLPCAALKSGLCTQKLSSFMENFVHTKGDKNEMTVVVKVLEDKRIF